MDNKPMYALESVDRALMLAHLLQLEGPMGVSTAAARLNVSASTAHRLLAMLVFRDFAERVEGRLYGPGPALRQVRVDGATLATLRMVALPRLAELVARVHETAHLAVLITPDIRFVCSSECDQVLRVGDRSGRTLPAHLTSAGVAMMAQLEPAEYESSVANLNPASRATTSRVVRAARAGGFAVNNQRTEPGVTALGVALRRAPGSPPAAITLGVPTSRYQKVMLPRWVRELRRCADAICGEMGHVAQLAKP